MSTTTPGSGESRLRSTGTEFSGGISSAFLAEGEELPPGLGPWQLAWRRLRRNKVALGFGGLFILIVVLCLLAPVYANDVAHTTAAAENITGTVKVGARPRPLSA
jgi:N-terminal TM domain of oligopeptide transport permease C